ncbi:hypothetical protein HDF16_003125 [Granulicella aggregans]|jgi:hypothetical protein|uniref:Uncharacterized protein n=1 Tax=Granulicella aggregans TaxID=474949 RepID=A0A7W8E4E1_9BACT|nr:hypothetical protein [Granulicella aggregans]MBB5058411.1 hypothetical protein [Granulicella aggregans]
MTFDGDVWDTSRAMYESEPGSQPSNLRSRIYLLALLLFLISSQCSIAQSIPLIKAIHVKLRLSETVSSANAKVRQPVLLEVLEPVQEDGKTIIAAGAQAHAIVTTARRSGHNHRQGRLVLTIQTVNRTDGSQAKLKSATVETGSGKGEIIFGPCTFPLPTNPVGLFRKGDDVVLTKGTVLEATTSLSN